MKQAGVMTNGPATMLCLSTLTCVVLCIRYDDEHGDYRMVLGDHVGYRFEIMGRLGKGSFGQVTC